MEEIIFLKDIIPICKLDQDAENEIDSIFGQKHKREIILNLSFFYYFYRYGNRQSFFKNNTLKFESIHNFSTDKIEFETVQNLTDFDFSEINHNIDQNPIAECEMIQHDFKRKDHSSDADCSQIHEIDRKTDSGDLEGGNDIIEDSSTEARDFNQPDSLRR